jgi:N-acetylmuramoyl-L-alanine amidase
MSSGVRLLAALVLAVTTILPGLTGGPVYAQAAPIVCIDPGHGGSDPGTSGAGILEKQLNLDVAVRFGDLLQANGYAVVYTRTTDVALGNTERAKLCNAAKATILISVHHNGSTDPKTDYTAGLYQKRIDRDLAQTISAHVAPVTSGVDRGLMQFASGVLLKSNMPATISEGYFLTATREQERLLADYWGYVSVEAQALVNGVAAYVGTA